MHLAIEAATLPPVHRAAFEASIPRLLSLLHAGADPNEPGCVRDECDGWNTNPGPSYVATPLMLAAASSQPKAGDAVRVLLKAGGNPELLSTRGDAALWFAAAAGNTRGMRALLDAGARPDRPCANGITPICESAAARNVNCVRLLLHFGASPHPVAINEAEEPVEPAYPFRIPLFAAATSGSAACLQLLLSAGARAATLDIYGANALMHASTAEVIHALLAAGCPRDTRDVLSRGALDYAVENGHRDVLFALVDAGLDINERDPSGRTLLLRYCSSLDIRAEMVGALIEADADVHARWFQGRSALHEAVQLFGGDRRGKLREVIISLVKAGVDVNVPDDSLSTPLHYAVGEEGLELGAVRTLLELGADPTLKNVWGKQPVDFVPDHVRSWKHIVAESPSIYQGLDMPENVLRRFQEEEKAGRFTALAAAEEVLQLLNDWRK
jgi:ankyrin repeat protein